MEPAVKVEVIKVIKRYNDNSVRYSLLEKRSEEMHKALEKLEEERKAVFVELTQIREEENDMYKILQKSPMFDMELFKKEVQEIANNLGVEKTA